MALFRIWQRHWNYSVPKIVFTSTYFSSPTKCEISWISIDVIYWFKDGTLSYNGNNTGIMLYQRYYEHQLISQVPQSVKFIGFPLMLFLVQEMVYVCNSYKKKQPQPRL